MAKKESSELTLKSNRGEKTRNISRDVTISIVLVVVLVSSLVISLSPFSCLAFSTVANCSPHFSTCRHILLSDTSLPYS